VIRRIKASWRIFAGGRPGLRFRERYRLRRSRGHGVLHPVRLANLAGGAGLIVVSAVFGWLPVLGWGTVVLGLAMIAGEVQPVARLMDRWEVGARRLLGPPAKTIGRLPVWAQLCVSLTGAIATFALVYGLYSLALGA
jgi:hypothetical protein